MNLSGLSTVVEKGKYFLNENSAAILTAVGVAGTGVTAYLTGRSTIKAVKIIEQAEHVPDIEEMTRREKIKLVWKHYIPPVISGITTVAAIIGANRLASRKIAALVTAAGISERALQEYRSKIVQRLGRNENTKIRDEIAQERVSNNPPGGEVVLIPSGRVLCYDMTTGRYFQSTVEDIKRAENKINYEINHYMNASLSEFYDEIGLPPTAYTDSVGFNTDNMLEVQFSTVMAPDDRPCIAIDFANPPISGYHRFDYS
jgi:hypothetical protein